MIDIHTHVLPGMDDGPPDLETAVAMLEMARADGITDIVATPHASLQYAYNPDLRTEQLDQLSRASSGRVRLHPGCELHLTPENVEAVLRKPENFTINGKDCVLLELPDRPQPRSAECAVQMLLQGGIRPVIAHPERNLEFHRNAAFAINLIRMGCHLQITAQSIMGSFGSEPRKCARILLKEGKAHFVASDAHGLTHRRPLLSPAFSEILHEYGEFTARLLFEENPRALLSGNRVCSPRPHKRPFIRSLLQSFHDSSVSVTKMS